MENNLPIDIKILNPPQNIIFLDVDGVLNNQFFSRRPICWINTKYLLENI